MATNVTSTCKLCEKHRELRLSHIVPELLYKPIYDKQHRIFKRRGGALVKEKPIQKGIRERLLCADCELKLSKWEGYFAKVLSTVLYTNSACTDVVGPGRHRLKGLDCKQTRLFFLSILWRMSIAKGEMWSKCTLDHAHEEELRKMLFDAKPGDSSKYPFGCLVPLIAGQFNPDFMRQPESITNDEETVVRVILSGLIITFLIGKDYAHHNLADFFLKDDGTWIWGVANVEKIPFLLDEVLEMYKARLKEKGKG